MSTSLKIDLHKLAKFTNLALPLLTLTFLFIGTVTSFYFHFLTITFLIMTVINLFYMRVQTSHTVLRNFGLIGQGRYIIESIGPELQRGLVIPAKAKRVEHYVKNCTKEFKELLSSAGCRSARELTYERLYTPSGSNLFIHDTGQAPYEQN